MPVYHRHFKPGQLQFITASTYRRVPIFSNSIYCRPFVETVRAVRTRLDFLLIGWVLMPEHFHLLLQPGPAESPSNIIKALKQACAFAILEALRAQCDLPSCRSLLRSFRLPPTVHGHAHYRVWQRRFVPFNVYTEEKRLQKLDYMHNNPVKRGLVASPGEWPWSSWCFYCMGDTSVPRPRDGSTGVTEEGQALLAQTRKEGSAPAHHLQPVCGIGVQPLPAQGLAYGSRAPSRMSIWSRKRRVAGTYSCAGGGGPSEVSLSSRELSKV